MKTCSKCSQEKVISEFYPNMGRCKSCHNIWCRAWNKRNPEKAKLIREKWISRPENKKKEIVRARSWQAAHPERDKLNKVKRALLKNYQLSYDDYCKMVDNQSGKCAICSTIPIRRLDVDHNHETGKIRQLLCSNCNTAIGLFKDNPNILRAAASYLELHNTP